RGKRPELLAAVEGLRMPVGERLLEDRAVALRAAGLADERRGLVFEGMVAAIGPGASQVVEGFGLRSLLKRDSAEQPESFGVRRVFSQVLQVGAGLVGPADAEEGFGEDLPELDRFLSLVGDLRVDAKDAAKRLGGSGQIKERDSDHAQGDVGARFPAP